MISKLVWRTREMPKKIPFAGMCALFELSILSPDVLCQACWAHVRLQLPLIWKIVKIKCDTLRFVLFAFDAIFCITRLIPSFCDLLHTRLFSWWCL
jgi:hypothetical protein